NSGLIQAVATNAKGGIPVTAIAFNITDYAVIGPDDTYSDGASGFQYQGTKTNTDALHDDQAAFVNTAEAGQGIINATIAGTQGGEADGILITANATLPSIINSGSISAIATTTASLAARAIWDRSGTLTYIQNNGLISAAATTLDNGAQIAYAIDLSADTEDTNAGKGVLILNQATVNGSARIIGDIRFGTGDYQTVDVEGASTTNTATIVGNINFGGGSTAGTDALTIGDFATVTGKITANETVGVTVNVNNGGTLNLLNDTTAL